jgi:hypothetical protein
VGRQNSVRNGINYLPPLASLVSVEADVARSLLGGAGQVDFRGLIGIQGEV